MVFSESPPSCMLPTRIGACQSSRKQKIRCCAWAGILLEINLEEAGVVQW